jgi:hypothetical protein
MKTFVARLLPSVLDGNSRRNAEESRLGTLREDLRPIFRTLEQEIETRTTALGIRLVEASAEREANRSDMAWRAVELAEREWKYLTKLLLGVLSVIEIFLPSTREIQIIRRVASDRLKSREVMDNVRLYEFLDNIYFNPESRFELQIRFLHTTITNLFKAFEHLCSEARFSLDSSDEFWTHLECYRRDFDLLTRETPLAFLTLLACQTPGRAQELASNLRGLIEQERSVWVPSVHL